MKKKRKITIYVLIGFIIVIGSTLYYFIGINSSRSTFGKNNYLTASGQGSGLKTIKPEVVYTNETIDVSGHIQPYEYENLAFNISGKIIYLPFSQGTRVNKGTLLAKLDDTKEKYQLAEIDYEIEQTKLSGESRKLELLKLQREIYTKELADTRLYAGINGIIASVDKNLNDTVKAGERVLRIINTKKMKSIVEVDELDAPKLKIGQKVIFHFDALPSIEATGRVSEIPVESTVTSEGIAVVDTELTLDNPPKEIMPNYSFNAEIIVKEKKKLLLLDKKAIIERNGKEFVILKKPSLKPPSAEEGQRPVSSLRSLPRRLPFKEIVTKNYDSKRVHVLSGLKGNEEIIVPTEEILKKTVKSVNPLSIFGIRTPRFRKRPR